MNKRLSSMDHVAANACLPTGEISRRPSARWCPNGWRLPLVFEKPTDVLPAARHPLYGSTAQCLRTVRLRYGHATRVFLCAAAHEKQKDRKSTRLNSSHEWISYAVFCLKK